MRGVLAEEHDLRTVRGVHRVSAEVEATVRLLSDDWPQMCAISTDCQRRAARPPRTPGSSRQATSSRRLGSWRQWRPGGVSLVPSTLTTYRADVSLPWSSLPKRVNTIRFPSGENCGDPSNPYPVGERRDSAEI